jgi:hypothetical protein
MDKCEICGYPKEDDLFSAVTREPVCSICKVRFIGDLPTTQKRIEAVREYLGLVEGEYLAQDNATEAARILGK